MSWKQDSKMLNEIQHQTVTCECGHRMRITNKYKREICNYCGRMVYVRVEDKKRNEFKSKIRSILNESN